jgi:hypothetical protein
VLGSISPKLVLGSGDGGADASRDVERIATSVAVLRSPATRKLDSLRGTPAAQGGTARLGADRCVRTSKRVRTLRIARVTKESRYADPIALLRCRQGSRALLLRGNADAIVHRRHACQAGRADFGMEGVAEVSRLGGANSQV